MDTLLSMCRKKSRNEAVSSAGALKDLLQGSVLPDRKLRYFGDQPGLGAKDTTDQHLILWVFEDYLKKYYFDFLGILENLSLDPLPFPRNHTVRYFYDLLKEKPEQEANLLRLLVNKLVIYSSYSLLVLIRFSGRQGQKNCVQNIILLSTASAGTSNDEEYCHSRIGTGPVQTFYHPISAILHRYHVEPNNPEWKGL